MANINATTPQLRLVKDWVDAYLTLNLENVERYISKNFTFQTFPKIAELPDETKGVHLERYGELLSLFTKMEAIFHEVIEAPGKVVLQFTVSLSTVDGTALECDSLSILTLVEEDGELKVLEFKDFSDPEKRGKLHDWVAKVLARGRPVA